MERQKGINLERKKKIKFEIGVGAMHTALLAVLFICMLSGFAFAADVPITSCQNLSTPNTNYIVTQNIVSLNSCFNIKADNVTLDCQGYNLTVTGDVIRSDQPGYDYITVKNCIAYYYQWESSTYFISFINTKYSIIRNNTVIWKGKAGSSVNSYGIQIGQYSDPDTGYNQILNNTFIAQPETSGRLDAIYITSDGGNNIIADNVMEVNIGEGIRLWATHNNNITNNRIISGNRGVRMESGSTNSSIVGNNISSSSEAIYSEASSQRIYILNNTLLSNYYSAVNVTSCALAIISGNNITSKAGSNPYSHAVSLLSSGAQVTNNKIIMEASGGNDHYGVSFDTCSGNITNNNISTSNTVSGPPNHGIGLKSSPNINISNNNISIRSGASSSGVFIQLSSDNTTVFNNTINTSSPSSGGVSIIGTTQNKILNNTIYIDSYSRPAVRFESTSNNLVSGNNIEAKGSGAHAVMLVGSNSNSFINNVVKSTGSSNLDYLSEGDSSGNVIVNMTFNTTSYPVTASFSYSGNVQVDSSNGAADSPDLINISKYLDIYASAATVSLNVSYNDSDLAGLDPNSLKLYRYNGTAWGLVPGSNGADTNKKIVYATITNFSTFGVFGITPDTTPPAWNPIPTDQSIPFGSGFSYDANATDANTITYSINDTANFKINSSTGLIQNKTALSARTYWLQINVTDVAGNSISAIISVTVLPDITPPVWNPTPTNQMVTEMVAFSYTVYATDANPITYSINDTARFQINPSTGLIQNNTALSIGTYGLQINATDNSGNSVSALINVTVSVAPDTTAPTTNLSVQYAAIAGGFYTSDVNVSLSATDSGYPSSGVAYTNYSYDNIAWNTYSIPVQITCSLNCTQNFYYRSVDLAGNVEGTKSALIKIDKRAANVSVPTTGANISNAIGTVNISIPSGAVPSPISVTIQVQNISATWQVVAADGTLQLAKIINNFTITPAGYSFSPKKVNITFAYTHDYFTQLYDSSKGKCPNPLGSYPECFVDIWYFVPATSTWTAIGCTMAGHYNPALDMTCKVDYVNNKLIVETTHFSEFALGVVESQEVGNVLTVGNVESYPGQTVTIPIYLDNLNDIYGMQFVFQYPGLLDGEPVQYTSFDPTERTAGAIQALNPITSGLIRFAALFGMNSPAFDQPLAAGSGAIYNVQFTVKWTASPGAYDLTLTNVKIGNLTANALPLIVLPGTLTITSGPPDYDPPTSNVTISGEGQNGWYNGVNSLVYLQFTATDNNAVKSIFYCFDTPSSPTDCSSTANFQEASGAIFETGISTDGNDGISTIYYYAVDRAGNVESQIHSETIKIDATPPVVTDNLPDWWVNGELSVTMDANDSIPGIETSGVADFYLCINETLPGCVLSAPNPDSFNLQDGVYFVSFYARDAAGNPDPNTNPELIHTKMISIDRTAPNTTANVTASFGIENWTNAPVEIELTAEDVAGNAELQKRAGLNATYYCISYSDGSCIFNATDYPGQGQTTISGEGRFIYKYYSEDNGGRLSPYSEGYEYTSLEAPGIGNIEEVKEIIFNIDMTPATTEISYTCQTDELQGLIPGTTYNYSYCTITLDASDPALQSQQEGSGVFATLWKVGVNEFQEYTGPFNVSMDNTAKISLSYYSIDKALNNEEVNTADVIFDTIAPELSTGIQGTVGKNGWYTSDVNLTITATDDSNITGICSRINGTQEECASPQ